MEWTPLNKAASYSHLAIGRARYDIVVKSPREVASFVYLKKRSEKIVDLKILKNIFFFYIFLKCFLIIYLISENFWANFKKYIFWCYLQFVFWMVSCLSSLILNWFGIFKAWKFYHYLSYFFKYKMKLNFQNFWI